ncbi:hypothetical protein [Paracoccus sp. AK26]|uniref:hypothetical protein n=1 Tax=Paracoccus sp. AK26 TaxID=2589076 RepID=UPI001428050F|nr:hypothetical protein [Paracoccus sp. AK26]QIR85021.1 hypothetical protein FIU66_07260 [Paracoccus sp. AK26]
MKEQGHKMLISAKQFEKTEALRLHAIKAAAAIPEECGPDIAPSPARGGFVLQRNIELLPVGTDKVEAVHRGFGGRAAIRRADVFDAMIAAALRAKRPVPLTPGQIAVGRRYHDLVELLTADGTKLSSLQSSFGGGAGRDWMDRRIEFSAELEGMRRRIGIGPAIVLRRVRPSQRHRHLQPGERAPHIFTRRDLVDAVCLKGKTIKQALVLFDWQDNGRNSKAALEALSGTLDAMIGYRG